MNTSDGIIILPTRGRAGGKLQRCLRALKETGTTTPGLIAVAEDDWRTNKDAYAKTEIPPGWNFFVGDYPDTATATEAVRARFPDAAFYIWFTDDNIAETPEWDRLLVSHLTGNNIVSTAFGEKSSRMNGAIAFSGDLIRAIGYIYPPGLKHLFLDDVFEEIGRMTGCWQVLPDVMVRHYHGPKVGEPDTTSERVNTFWENDRKAYLNWQKTDGVAAVERIMTMMEGKGFKVAHNDFRGVKLCIVIPNGSGSYRHEFASSLQNTISYIKQFGGEASVIALPGCSDIALARNRLMARYLDTDCTHALWLDDDMQFEVGIVGELIRADKDFCAVAGRLKRDELMFAARCQDDHGRDLPIRVDAASGFLEVTAVGFAFVLLKRDTCVRICQANADLEYVTASGEREVGVFLPQVLNGRWCSEDFSFCQRWKTLGGKIFVGAHLPIGHIGTRNYSGSWAEGLTEKVIAEQAAA